MIHYYDAVKLTYNSDGNWVNIHMDDIKKYKSSADHVKIANIIVSKDVRPR